MPSSSKQLSLELLSKLVGCVANEEGHFQSQDLLFQPLTHIVSIFASCLLVLMCGFPLRFCFMPVTLQGITKTTLSSFFSPAVDVVSLGSLTQGYSCADYSLKIYKGSGITSVDKAVSAGVA